MQLYDNPLLLNITETTLSQSIFVAGESGGRLVAFSAGKENMHGVLAVTKGRRHSGSPLTPNRGRVPFLLLRNEIRTASEETIHLVHSVIELKMTKSK